MLLHIVKSLFKQQHCSAMDMLSTLYNKFSTHFRNWFLISAATSIEKIGLLKQG